MRHLFTLLFTCALLATPLHQASAALISLEPVSIVTAVERRQMAVEIPPGNPLLPDRFSYFVDNDRLATGIRNFPCAPGGVGTIGPCIFTLYRDEVYTYRLALDFDLSGIDELVESASLALSVLRGPFAASSDTLTVRRFDPPPTANSSNPRLLHRAMSQGEVYAAQTLDEELFNGPVILGDNAVAQINTSTGLFRIAIESTHITGFFEGGSVDLRDGVSLNLNVQGTTVPLPGTLLLLISSLALLRIRR